jgi:hypothetical protein
MNRKEASYSSRPVYRSQRRRSSFLFYGLIVVGVVVSLFFLLKGNRTGSPKFNPPQRMQRGEPPELARPPAQRPMPDQSLAGGPQDVANVSLTIPREFQQSRRLKNPPNAVNQPDRARRLRGDVGTDWRQSYAPQVEPIKPPVARAGLTALRPYTEWNVHETAADSLGRIGEAAVPSLVRALGHAEPKRRAEAARLLGHVGPGAKLAVPALANALNDPSPEVQKSAAWALGQVGPAAAAAVEPLMRLVEETEAVGISNGPTDP